MLYYSFLYIIEDGAFQAVFVLFIFALLNYKQFPRNSIFRFLIVGIIVTIIIRLMAFPSGRYDIPLSLYFIPISVFGFPYLVNLSYKLIQKKITSIKIIDISLFLILILSIFCIGKALSSPDRKSYIEKITDIIKKSEREAILLYDETKEGPRVAYRAGIKYFPFEAILDKDLKNMNYALDTLHSKKFKTFVLVKESDKDFRQMFKDKNMQFPSLKLIKEFKEKGGVLSLYEYQRH